jgi:tRNA threonylcarbamoyladenosine biosynthesis protein TsaB
MRTVARLLASLKEVGIAYKDLVAIAVSHGPGSYTGLRIGVSAAKAVLCFRIL